MPRTAIKKRTPVIPPFGPRGCHLAKWQSYTDTLRAHLEAGGHAEYIGGGGEFAQAPAQTASICSRTGAGLLAALDDANTRVINIQEPWATMIATGRKDFENRPDAFPKGGGWMVVVASKLNYSAPEWDHRQADIRRRLRWSGSIDAPAFEQAELTQAELKRFEQHALALAKVVSIDNWHGDHPLHERQSIWNNGDAHAWRITEVHKLIDPVFFGNGTLGKPYFKNCAPCFQLQVRDQLLRLAGDE